MKSSWLYKALAISVIAYFAGMSFAHIPGSEKAIVRCGAALLVLSLASLGALIFPTVRASLREANQRPSPLISLAIVALYSIWAGSLLVFPISE
jgi:hypothetical protein